jgi:hypothetical protein
MNEHGVIRRISWRDLFPWLILFRTFRIAISPSLLAVAVVASILSLVGWRVAGLAFIPRAEGQHWLAPRKPVPDAGDSQLRSHLPTAALEYLPAAPTGILEGYFNLAEPMKRLFQLDQNPPGAGPRPLTLGETAYYAFGTLWTLAIWAFAGGVITRRAVVQLGAEEPVGIAPAAKYAGRRYLWYLLTPLYPLLGVALLAIPIALFGLPLRLGQIEGLQWIQGLWAIVAGLLWILVIIAGLGAAWLLAGLIFGWPLMWPAISAEREGDPFDAFSRSYSYVYGKPLHYFFYVVVAALFGALCVAVVTIGATLVLEFGFWALSWGAGGGNALGLRDLSYAYAAGAHRDLPEDARLLAIGTAILGIVVMLVRQVVVAFTFTYFWCAASGIYLLLRMDVDHKEMDEVYLEDEPDRTAPARVAAPPRSETAAEPDVRATPGEEPPAS